MALLEGMYQKDGHVYKVQISKAGHPYALLALPEGGFDYDAARGVARKLTARDMLTLAQAKEFGALYGVCCVCGRHLTNPVSIEAGIGPICAQGEQFANPDAFKGYQTDEAREAAIAREDAAAAEKSAPKRTLDAGTDKWGALFLLKWDYNDADFGEIKNKFRAYEWNLLHQKWDGSIKSWRASATPDTIPVILGFAKEFNFEITPAAQAVIDRLAPGAKVEEAEIQDTPIPTNFAALAAIV